MDAEHIAEFQAAVERDVIRPISQQPNTTLHGRSRYHPIIATAYRNLVQTLYGHLNHLPPIDVCHLAIQNLVRHCERANSELSPSTPPGSASLSLFPLNDTLRAVKAQQDARNLKDKLASKWLPLSRACSDIYRDLGSQNAYLIDDSIETFLYKLQKTKSDFVPYFENLETFDINDQSQLEASKQAIRSAMAHILNKHHLSSDETICYLIAAIPLVTGPVCGDPFEAPLRQRLAQGFCRQYRGDAPQRLLNFAKHVNLTQFAGKQEGKRPYFKGTPIVQSSGTGKTRMVIELGRISPLLFICIRPSTTTARNGYPLGDKPIMDLVFTHFPKYKATEDEKAAALLAAWFDAMASSLAELDSGQEKFQCLVELNTYGTEEHATRREAFFRSISDNACILLQRGPVPGGYKQIFQQYLDPPVRALSKQLESVQDHLASQHGTAHQSPVFVAIDECVTLSSRLLDSITRAWNHIGQLEGVRGSETVCFWLILISTNSSASNLIRPQQEHNSDRDKAAVPLPTFVGVGFDVLRTELEPLGKASEVASITNIQKYGRPLWVSLVEENFWPIAIAKLMGTQKSFVRGQRTVCFNVLASRLALRYIPTRSADSLLFGEQATFARTAVDRHMRILTKVDRDSTLHVSSPSEPVLAIAASLIMLPTPADQINENHVPDSQAMNRYGSILETLQQVCLSSADVDILKNVRGELMVRVLMMIAWDATKVTQQEFLTTERLHWKAESLLRPETLDSILGGLVQLDDAASTLVRSHIDVVRHQVQDRFCIGGQVNAWAHFTHFDILETMVEEISPEYLWYCWKRGVAIQMAHSQHGIDGIIPVFVGDLSQPFVDDAGFPVAQTARASASEGHSGEAQAARQMTYVAWEAKNRKVTSRFLADQDARRLKHAGPRLKHEAGNEIALTDRGLLTVIADMGAPFQPPRVTRIQNTESLQVWIRGIEHDTIYPCLDRLCIRSVVVNFLGTVASHVDYESYNRICDPMDLQWEHSRISEEQDAAPSSSSQPHDQGSVAPREESMDTLGV